jgi:HEAT repeat protein
VAFVASAVAAPPPPPNPMSGKSVGELGKVLESDAPEMDRANAALALSEFVTPPDAKGGRKPKKGRKAPEWELKIPEGFIDACSIGLADRASAVRFYSGHALALAGADALPALVKAVGSDNDDEKISAIHAIGMMAKTMGGKKGSAPVDLTPVFGSAVSVLQKALKDDNYIVRETACATFSRMGIAGAPAIDDLIACLEDEHFCVVNRAVQAVAAADPSGARSVPALVKALDSGHDVREFIVKELGRMGAAAKGAVPALCRLVGEDKNSWQVALESTKALLRIVTCEEKPEQDAVAAERNRALSAIGEAMANQDAKFLQARIRNTVLDHKGYCPIGAEAEPLVDFLEQTLREWARTEKGYFGPALPKLCEVLAQIGKNYKTDHLVALAKELKAAKDTREVWLKEFEPILNLENK